jgi:protein-L-isoaspartate(D-aspartate) O-methyltransferase
MNAAGDRFNGIGMTSTRTRARMIERVRELGVKDETVLTAMAAVPRHIFVEEALASRAYEDSPLPIGAGQTISQPYVVARMVELLRAGERLGKVLEIGTGCGYQALLAAEHAERVVATDISPRALSFAAFNAALNRVGNLELRRGSFFEPVEGERFELVVSNPPYAVSPESRLVYRDAGLPRDEVSALVVRGAAGALRPGVSPPWQ